MKIAVVIPAYKVKNQVIGVISSIGPEVQKIFVVDDACPEKSGAWAQSQIQDPRLEVLFQQKNSGVGGATLRGFVAAQQQGFSIAVKIDGDGQMDPTLIPQLVQPLLEGKADLTKGNRFYSPRALTGMPFLRLLGNAGLSILAKITTGYWTIMDPTNGFLALHTALLPLLETSRISPRYFFENDLLFRLGLVRAVVVDVPMDAHYADEQSNLSIMHSLISFPGKFFVRFFKRIFYRYFLRDFNIASILMVKGVVLLAAGTIFGLYHWIQSTKTGVVASSGTVMLSALPVLVGFQMLTFALLYDVLMVPKDPLHKYLDKKKR